MMINKDGLSFKDVIVAIKEWILICYFFDSKITFSHY